MPEDLGNPTRMPQQNDDFAANVTNQILAGFSGLQRELSEMRKLLSQSQKSDSKYKFATSDFDDLLSDIRSSSKSSKNTAKDIEGLIKDFKRDVTYAKSSASTKRESLNRQISYSGEYGINKIYSTRVAKSTADIESKLEKLYEAADNSFSNQLAHLENLEAKKARETEASSKMQRKIDELDGKIGLSKDRDEIDALTVLRDQILEAKSKTDSSIASTTSKIESVKKDLEKDLSSRSKEYQTLVRSLRDTEDLIHRELSSVLKAVDDAKSGTDSLRGMSAYLNENVKRPEDVETELDKLARAVEKQKDIIHSAILAIEKKLEDKTLDEQERKNLDYQRQLLVKEYDALNKWTPRQEMFSKAVKTFADAGKSILGAIGNTAIKRLEDYYLNSYKESFNKVYDSIENTRNTVSARLKLDQGGFSDLQADIQSEIEALGIEASVTQSDVNDALVSLQAAGVTDPEMLKSLAIEQAKLIASGSSLNLGNEEMIQNLRQVYQQQIQAGASQQEALDGITNLLDDIGAYQSMTGTAGWDSSLVNGGIDRIVNNMLKLGITGQKNIDQMSSDIGAYIQASESYYSRGLDPDQLYQYINDIANKSIDENSTFEQILQKYGINSEAVLTKGMDELLREIDNASRNILQETSKGDNRYISQISNAYELGLEGLEAIRQRDSDALPEAWTEEQKAQAKRDSAYNMQQGTFISETRKHQNKTENSMAGIATEAEKMYKGNDPVNAGFDMVETGLGAIKNVASEILHTMFVQSAFGKQLSSEGASITSAGNFLTGGANFGAPLNGKISNGSAAGKLGKGLTVAAGVGQMGYAVIDTIKEHDSGDSALDTAINLFDEPELWSGIGTTIGGVLGGPVAGAVVGGLMGAGGKIGNALAEHIENKLDPFEEAVNEFRSSSKESLDASVKNLESVKSTLTKYQNIQKKNDTEQMKLLLMEEANISAQSLRDASDEKIQELFQKNLVTQQENLEKEAENQVAFDSIINKNAQETVDLNKKFNDLAFSETGISFADMSAKEQEEYKKKLTDPESSYSKTFRAEAKDIMVDVGSHISEMQQMTDDEKANYLLSKGKSAKDIKGMESAQIDEEIRKTVIDEYSKKSGFTDETDVLFKSEMDAYEKRHDIYVEQEKIFQDRIKTVEQFLQNNNEDVNTTNVIAAYLKRYHGDKNYSNFNNSDTKDIKVGEDGSLWLDPGILYRESYAFATGLTDVPYDNYPAILHKGERILTKEEAKAYNEMSSFAVNNLMNNFNGGDTASNVFSTTSYGIDVDKSIGNQTDILSRKLDQVISAINNLSIRLGGASSQSAAHKNVLRGNSNITQLNTL